MEWGRFRARLAGAVAACKAVGARDTLLEVHPAATPAEVEAVEQQLKLTLPVAFRTALLGFSRTVNMYWYLKSDVEGPFSGIFRGDCSWSLAALPELEQGRRGWIDACFSDPVEPYARVWHGKLAFAAVGNGDVLALDLALPSAPVVFLSHDDSAIHGWRLGDDFLDFLDRSSRLAFVGLEDWQLEPFLANESAGLLPDCPNARRWREWLGFIE